MSDDPLVVLTSGTSLELGSLNRSVTGASGVFTVWVEECLVFFGAAGNARESKPSNARQADGVTGRIRKFSQQPGAPTIRRLRRHFGHLWESNSADRDENAARPILRNDGRVRIYQTDDRSSADMVLASVKPSLERLLLSN